MPAIPTSFFDDDLDADLWPEPEVPAIEPDDADELPDLPLVRELSGWLRAEERAL